MSANQKYLLFALLLALVMADGIWFLKQLESEPWDSPEFKAAMAYWGGNPNEVRSHRIDLLACSGVFACLLILLCYERHLRRRDGMPMGGWSALVGSAIAFSTWSQCVWLDMRSGEGTVILVIPVDFIPLVVPSVAFAHVLWSTRGVPAWLDLLATVGLIAAMVRAQLIFEPSGTGAPNGYIFYALAASWLCLGVPALLRVWSVRRHLHGKGYSWVTWRDALLFAVSHRKVKTILPSEEVAVLPGYRPNDIRALCILPSGKNVELG